jgi:hypothetical protein
VSFAAENQTEEKMRKILFVIILFLLVFFLYGEVKNTDKPLKGEWDFKPQKVWQISEAAGNVLTGFLIQVSDDGTCFVSDAKPHLTYIFDSAGNLKKTFGKRGERPGEIRFLHNSYIAGDTFIAGDFRNRLHFFTKDGKFIKSIVNYFASDFPWFFIDEDNYISSSTNRFVLIDYRWKDKGEIKHMNLKTGKKNVLEKFSYKDKPFPFPNGKSARLPGFHSRLILGYDYDNQRVYYGLNDSYVIHALDLKGNRLNTFSVDRERKKIKRETIAEVFDLLKIQFKEKVGRFPNRLTYFQKIQVSGGLIYVFESHLGDHLDKLQVDIFSPEGKYLYRSFIKPGPGTMIYFPYGFNNLMIKNHHLYMSVEDDDGEISIVKYKISLPGH